TEQLCDRATVPLLVELLASGTPSLMATRLQRRRRAARAIGQRRELSRGQDRHLAITRDPAAEAIDAADFVLVLTQAATRRAGLRAAVFWWPGTRELGVFNSVHDAFLSLD
ncbi:MAG: hypothetical protein WAL03_24120, partial [Pseudolabrys sp.]